MSDIVGGWLFCKEEERNSKKKDKGEGVKEKVSLISRMIEQS
jgi:hypothetical protein